MKLSDLDQLLQATLAGGPMSVTLTDMPAHERGVRELIAKACEMASLKKTPLLSVELPRDLMLRMGADYGDLELRDCGGARVLRFVYGAAAAGSA